MKNLPVSQRVLKHEMIHIPEIAEELRAIIIERGKNAREEIIRAYWEVGQTLREHETRGEPITKSLQQLSLELDCKGWGVSTLWSCLRIYDEHPKFESVYETEYGQSISIRKLIGQSPPHKDTRPECNHKCKRHCSAI